MKRQPGSDFSERALSHSNKLTKGAHVSRSSFEKHETRIGHRLLRQGFLPMPRRRGHRASAHAFVMFGKQSFQINQKISGTFRKGRPAQVRCCENNYSRWILLE